MMLQKPTGKKAKPNSAFKAFNPLADRADLYFLNGTSVEAAKALLGRLLVSTVDGERRELLIAKVRAFEGAGSRRDVKEGISGPAGRIYLMRFRSALFFNITTGKAGAPSCVWIEEGITNDNKRLAKTQVTSYLGITKNMSGDLVGDKVDVLAGIIPKKVNELPLDDASENTAGIFEIDFSFESDVRKVVRAIEEF